MTHTTWVYIGGVRRAPHGWLAVMEGTELVVVPTDVEVVGVLAWGAVVEVLALRFVVEQPRSNVVAMATANKLLPTGGYLLASRR